MEWLVRKAGWILIGVSSMGIWYILEYDKLVHRAATTYGTNALLGIGFCIFGIFAGFAHASFWKEHIIQKKR